MLTVITHSDSDGTLAVATLLQYLDRKKAQDLRAYFSTPAKLLDIICISLLKHRKELGELYILDFSGTRETVHASAIYENAYWYDHHEWAELNFKLENVKIFVDSKLPSAVAVLAKFLSYKTEFEKYANEVDTNAVVTKEAERIRDIVSAYKRNFSGILLSSALFGFAKQLATKGLSEIFNPVYDNMIADYKKWLSQAEKEIHKTLSIYTQKGLKIAILDLREPIPVFRLFNLLKNHDEAPFDLFITKLFNKLSNSTKLELRTYTNKDVLALARFFGGGGHRVASGASVQGKLSNNDILKAIELLKL